VKAELLNAYERMDGWMDGRTDITKITVVFRNFANAAITENFSQMYDTYLQLNSVITTHWIKRHVKFDQLREYKDLQTH
jgi:hypothetical protein